MADAVPPSADADTDADADADADADPEDANVTGNDKGDGGDDGDNPSPSKGKRQKTEVKTESQDSGGDRTQSMGPQDEPGSTNVIGAADDADEDGARARREDTNAEVVIAERGAMVRKVAAEYLLYQLCMAAPSAFADCFGEEMNRCDVVSCVALIRNMREAFSVRGMKGGGKGGGGRIV